MKPDSRRTILAFYSPEEGRPEAAYLAVRRVTRGRVRLCGPEDSSRDSGKNLDDNKWLRLDGESLIVAEASESEVEAIVKQLQGIGSPAVFVLRDEPGGGSSGDPEPVLENKDKTLSEAAKAVAARRDVSYKSQPSILERLRQNEIALGAARRDLVEAARLGHSLTAAAEWLLDNAYLIRTQIAEIRRHFPKSNSKILPTLAHGYDLAQELVARSGNSLSEQNITEWLRDYQTVAPLTIAELWLFPLLLRMALIDALRRLAERVSRAQQLREAGYFWANRLAAGARQSPEEFENILHRMEAEAIASEPHFAVSLVEQLQDEEAALAPLQRWLETRFNEPVTEIIRAEHTQEAAQRISTANAFGSLRALPRIDFTKIFEAVSLVEAELRTDPVYTASDFATRDQCRRVVERIARHSALERARSRAAGRKAGSGGARSEERARDVLPALRRSSRVGSGSQVQRSRAHPIPADTSPPRFARVLGGIVGLTASFLALTVAVALDAGVNQTAMLVALGVLALFPLSELAIQIVNALVISLLPPEQLPKMDFENGIPEENATLVVVPMMLASPEVVRQEIEKLEVRFLANRDRIRSCSPVGRFHGFRRTCRARRCGIVGDREQRNRRAECALSGRAVSLVPPRPRLVRERRPVDRPREKARQDRGSESVPAAKDIRTRCTLSADLPISDPLRDHAGRRYAIASGHGAPDGGDDLASAEPRGDRSGNARAHARIHHHSAARQHRAARRDRHALHAHFRRHVRHRSLLPDRFRRAAGPVRRSDFSRQGDLRCAGVSRIARRPVSRRNAAQSRSDRRSARGRRPGQRYRAVRKSAARLRQLLPSASIAGFAAIGRSRRGSSRACRRERRRASRIRCR